MGGIRYGLVVGKVHEDRVQTWLLLAQNKNIFSAPNIPVFHCPSLARNLAARTETA
jgi:hypothetical protein